MRGSWLTSCARIGICIVACPHDSEVARAVKAAARQHQEAVWALHQTLSRLRSLLLEFYPTAISTFPQLKHHTALAVLAAAPTPTQARLLSRRQVVGILHRIGRRNDPGLAYQIVDGLRAPALAQPTTVRGIPRGSRHQPRRRR